jgi:hypothetical protein
MVTLSLPEDAPLDLTNIEIELSSNEKACVLVATAPDNPISTTA